MNCFIVSAVVLLLAVTSNAEGSDRSQVCPALMCPMIHIPKRCRQVNFVLGLDGKTQCRVCDSNKCDDGPVFSKRSDRSEVCPALMCPTIYIPKRCRQANFVLGLDGKTQCRVCDSNKCDDGPVFSKRSDDSDVCPDASVCPMIFPAQCRSAVYVTGWDGRTQCRLCDENGCSSGHIGKRSIRSQVCPAIMCPMIHIPKRCRQANFVLGLDGKTQCRVCDSNKCDDGPVFS